MQHVIRIIIDSHRISSQKYTGLNPKVAQLYIHWYKCKWLVKHQCWIGDNPYLERYYCYPLVCDNNTHCDGAVNESDGLSV